MRDVLRELRTLTPKNGAVQEGELCAVLSATLVDIPAEGLAVGVVDGPSTALAYRGFLAGEVVGPGTTFYGASLAKQVVASLLASMVLSGDASPDDPVHEWLPQLPRWMEEVRLRHLLHHTSDLPDVTLLPPKAPSNREVIDRLQRVDPALRIWPGVRFRYNNAGYVLLAEVVARICGRGVGDLAQETLFHPLQLTTTRLGGEPIQLPATPDPPGTIGDGGLWTSIADLTAWLVAMNDGTLGTAIVRRLETPGRLEDGSPLDYGWGVRITATSHGLQVTHGGSWATWLAKTVRIPDLGIAVAVLSTGSTEVAISDVGTQLAALLASSR